MPAFYLETAALIKRYKSEAGSDVMRELITGKRPGEYFLTSHFTLLEVHTVARRMLRGRELRRRQYERLLSAFAVDLREYYVRLLAVDDALVEEALDLVPAFH